MASVTIIWGYPDGLADAHIFRSSRYPDKQHYDWHEKSRSADLSCGPLTEVLLMASVVSCPDCLIDYIDWLSSVRWRARSRIISWSYLCMHGPDCCWRKQSTSPTAQRVQSYRYLYLYICLCCLGWSCSCSSCQSYQQKKTHFQNFINPDTGNSSFKKWELLVITRLQLGSSRGSLYRLCCIDCMRRTLQSIKVEVWEHASRLLLMVLEKERDIYHLFAKRIVRVWVVSNAKQPSATFGTESPQTLQQNVCYCREKMFGRSF